MMESDNVLDVELQLASAVADVGGAAPFAMLRQIRRNGTATTRELTAITDPLGTTRQTAVQKIVKRLERDGFVRAVAGAGTRHYELTEEGRDLVDAVSLGAAGPLPALAGRRLILIDGRRTQHSSILGVLSVRGVDAIFHTDGDWDYAAVCRDAPSLVRVLEDRLRTRGADSSSIRVASPARHGYELSEESG